MIINGFLSAVFSVVSFVIGLLPSGSTWTPDYGPVRTTIDDIAGLNAYFPVSDLLLAAGLALAIVYARIPWAAANWLWQRIRG